ncbi:hypothetical protein ACFXPY_33660 [Streptomyces sp. NPDC059153]|uniref:hypothetical protein n=1 Tax=Streptomyces sp. NPDC059153 TaxID=3346743 RepID=UPI0036744BB1
MLVHRLADDHVAVVHMLRFSARPATGRSHAVLPWSGSGHPVTREETVSSLLLLKRDFLKKSLGR